MYFDMTSYTAGVAGPMWPQEAAQNGWYNENVHHGSWNLWGHDQQKQWGQESSKPWVQESSKPWGQESSKPWGHEPSKLWDSGQENLWGRQDDYSEYNRQDYQQSFQVLDSRLANQARQLGHLAEEPEEVLVVNSASSGAYASLCADAAKADLIAFDAEWAPDHSYGSDNPISVLQLAFPISRRVYVLQLNRLDGQLPPEVKMMLVNPEVRKLGFAVDLNDRQKMQRSGIALTNGSVTDVQELCAAALGVIANAKSLSLKNAAFGLLGVRLDKDKRLSCSDWASKDLTPEQVRYAALDAWVPLRLCYQLS
jgi:hypothetical protein